MKIAIRTIIMFIKRCISSFFGLFSKKKKVKKKYKAVNAEGLSWKGKLIAWIYDLNLKIPDPA
jgi:hypothetical protein